MPTNLSEKVRNKLEKLKNLLSDLAVSTAAPNTNYRLTDEFFLNKNIVCSGNTLIIVVVSFKVAISRKKSEHKLSNKLPSLQAENKHTHPALEV